MKDKEKFLDNLSYILFLIGFLLSLIANIMLLVKNYHYRIEEEKQTPIPISGNVLVIPPPEITIEVFPSVSLNSVVEVPTFVASDFDTEIEDEYVNMIIEIADQYNISPSLVIAIIESESHGHPDSTSSGGAQGLMQIIPCWQQDRMNRLGVTSLYDPYGNILVGTDIMADLLEKYDIPTALMCYNEGQYGGAVQRAAAGNYSYYALKIMSRMNELEENLEK